VSNHDLGILLSVDRDEWRRETALIPAYFETFGSRLPTELQQEYDTLINRLGTATARS
jgi:phosphoenolpyruvate carboxykinase (GTP)